uniref:CCR4-NOT transcription complex subunit 4 n=1 Tax=Geotrypetes seraphini TaxID=260995 RepID=A0A6P8SA95_GEOSA|nr:CCR4-NOT transcription complex subunit 4 isoform X3 [Geotrypetes seraphini]
MSRSPEVKEDPVECPLCMEPLEIDDINFFPCTCGYQICRFCWHRIRTDENGLCPACRKVLKRPEYFGKFGKIHKVVINNSTSYAGSQGPSASAYVTYIRSEDALRAIQCVNNVVVDGRTLKASLGTTKYCSYFLKNMQCPKPDCMYLHELGDEAASFTKEEMQAGKHQEYEQKLLQELYKLNPNFLQPSAGTVDKNKNKVLGLQRPNSINKDAWPSLQSSSKSTNGLTMEHRKTPPILDNGSDPEHMTQDGPDSDFGSMDKPSESLSIGNGDSLQQILSSDTPSPPPGLSKASTVIPISSSNHNARSPFEAATTESQSLFSDNFRHPNPIPSGLPAFPSSSQTPSDWPTAPEPQSLFTSETIPVSSSTDWQAAFGFGSSKQQEDELGFDPFDITRKALADLIEKELSVQDQPSLSPMSLQNPTPHNNAKGPGSGFLHPAMPSNANSLGSTFSVLPQRFPQFQHRAVYSSFSFPGQATRYPWMAFPRNSITHLNHTANPTSNSNFLDLNVPLQHSTGLGGISIADNGSSIEGLNMKEWQDGLRALLPNININFGGLPNTASPSTNHSVPTSNTTTTNSLNWDSPSSWMDPAIITGIPASSANSLETLQDDNPPHWLKSLQALTEMDGPSNTMPIQSHHSNPFNTQIPLHRASWNPYPSPSNPSSFHSPPPGFQTAFRPPGKAPTDLLQSSTLDRH